MPGMRWSLSLSLRRLHGANVAKRRHGTALPETIHGHRKTSCALPYDTAYLVIRKREITWFSPLLTRFCLAWSGYESITKAKAQNGEKRLNLGVNERCSTTELTARLRQGYGVASPFQGR